MTFVLPGWGTLMRLPVLSRRHDRHRSRGQSLVELALIVPVLLLIMLFAIDLGRGFYSWIVLQNATRIGANFASLNANAWEANPDVATVTAEYAQLMQDDIDNSPCTATGPLPDPVFTDSAADTSGSGQTPDTAYDVGDAVKVSLTCSFGLITPIISAIIGSDLELGASSEFRIRAGNIAGLAYATAIPPPVVPTPTPVPTATATAPPSCPTPTADFIATPSSGDSPLTATITDTSTTAPGCPILSWSWTFEGANPATITGPGPHTVIFTKPPVQHDVTLVITNAGGSDTEFKNNFVRSN